jgi:hypothetical protein
MSAVEESIPQGAEAQFFVAPGRPKAEALGYLEAESMNASAKSHLLLAIWRCGSGVEGDLEAVEGFVAGGEADFAEF